MSENEGNTSGEPSPIARFKRWWLGLPAWLNVLIIVVVVAALVAVVVLVQRPNTAANAEQECKDRVGLKLKSPSTADFGDSSARPLGATPDRFEVTGVVDAENSFGGTVRLTYKCDLTYNGDLQSWSVALVDVRE